MVELSLGTWRRLLGKELVAMASGGREGVLVFSQAGSRGAPWLSLGLLAAGVGCGWSRSRYLLLTTSATGLLTELFALCVIDAAWLHR